MKPGGSRMKGREFEQLIAKALRKRWPDKVVRRSQQSHRAFESDVVVEGVPIWWELQHAHTPTPVLKLEQAERDVARIRPGGDMPAPVVVWLKTRSRTIYATMRAAALGETIGVPVTSLLVVTVEFTDWLKHVVFE